MRRGGWVGQQPFGVSLALGRERTRIMGRLSGELVKMYLDAIARARERERERETLRNEDLSAKVSHSQPVGVEAYSRILAKRQGFTRLLGSRSRS